jgi:hypothetical protein
VDPDGHSGQRQAAFTSGGVNYTAPKAGSYRFGVFNERHPDLGGELGNDVNRDGNPAGSSGLFGVLWETTSNTVWVDTNQNGSFADEAGMTDYKVRYDVGYFGTDRADTAYQDRMPFVVQTDGKNKVVNIGIVSGAHGSHVAGITAANGMFGGAMTGAAPGAKLVSVRVCLFVGGCTSHALLEGMILAAKQMNVDVINMSIGGLPALNDGNNARAALYDKLIETYKVQMFISAGNSGAGLNTIGDPSVASKVMSVGSYITNDTWKANYGSSTTKDDNIHPYSSRGPVRTAASSRRSSPPDRLCRRSPPGRVRPAHACRTTARRATRCSTAPRWPHRRLPALLHCSSRPPRRPARSTSPPSCARRSTPAPGSSTATGPTSRAMG